MNASRLSTLAFLALMALGCGQGIAPSNESADRSKEPPKAPPPAAVAAAPMVSSGERKFAQALDKFLECSQGTARLLDESDWNALPTRQRALADLYAAIPDPLADATWTAQSLELAKRLRATISVCVLEYESQASLLAAIGDGSGEKFERLRDAVSALGQKGGDDVRKRTAAIRALMPAEAGAKP
jgi:hypothetical protein